MILIYKIHNWWLHIFVQFLFEVMKKLCIDVKYLNLIGYSLKLFCEWEMTLPYKIIKMFSEIFYWNFKYFAFDLSVNLFIFFMSKQKLFIALWVSLLKICYKII